MPVQKYVLRRLLSDHIKYYDESGLEQKSPSSLNDLAGDGDISANSQRDKAS